MRIVTVIPIGRGISKETLSYFTKQDISPGSIVSIPIRNKTSFGLVVESKDAGDVKSEIKSLSYSIKKIENIESSSFLLDSFIQSAKKIADYNASSIGAVLSVLIPKTILEESSNLPKIPKPKNTTSYYETTLLQGDDEERHASYKSLIREEFAKNKSVFFCLPTTEDLLNAKNSLEKGIEKYTYVLHGGLPKKELIKIWTELIENPHPVLIITTGSFISIPRRDLGIIILEKESSRGYKMQQRPFLDIRVAIEIFAKTSNTRLVLGDTLLRVETLWEEKNGHYTELSPLKFRSLSTSQNELIPMRVSQDMKKKEFHVFSDKTKDIIKRTKENNEHTFLFCGRKGLYPITVCSDCGTVVVCKNCNAPVVLYSKKINGEIKNLFVCNHCGERRDSEELCVHCNGWRLNPLGIGVEQVAKELQDTLGFENVFIMDKDNITTHKQAVKIREAFYNTPGSVMVGTEMALTYLNQKIENSIVVSLDSYFSIPDYQINEKIFHILLSMRSLSEKNFVIQTRQENTKIFDHALKGNLLDFYRDEIEERREIGYPPFATYIKISAEGEKNTVKKHMEQVAKFLKPYEVSIFDAWNPGSKQKYTVNGLISLPKGRWIDPELLKKLRELPPYFAIRVDPATLL